MTETTTAADYAWLEERYESLTEAYCITLVRGLTAQELLRNLKAEPAGRVTGVEELYEPSYDVSGHSRLFVGAADLDGWALMVEYNGYLGTLDEIMLPLSRGRTVVSHFRNINAVDHFNWFEDGTLRLHFEPLFAHARDGSHPDELLTEMREAGFDTEEPDEGDEGLDGDEGDDQDFETLTAASFVLADRITGVRLTPELFASAEFRCGIAPIS
ncbi:DUF6461 domain-containing protein [Streptomyces fulvoviolaceus]|uniref:DUF6461 domain-containing protein n=1 Tax=Streptomyces fulvoviolaceus TaxID=285535 RepID=UPI000694DA07|nr:DUF6461 domain-containing protein [Streptomyces fulvoviolaceus]